MIAGAYKDADISMTINILLYINHRPSTHVRTETAVNGNASQSLRCQRRLLYTYEGGFADGATRENVRDCRNNGEMFASIYS